MDETFNKAVMIVENDHSLRVLMRRALEDAGYFVISVTNGADGLGILTKTSPPSLLIIGSNLPIMNADLFLNALNNNEDFKNIPIIQLLSEGGGLLPGICHHLTIPFENKDLIEMAKLCNSNA